MARVPRLHRHLDIWFCEGNGTIQYGLTPLKAYLSYMEMYERIQNECVDRKDHKNSVKAD